MKQANAAQKKWMSEISKWAWNNIGLLYGSEYDGGGFQLHHVLGRSAKHNKVAIGHWFVIPVPFELHDVSSGHPENVTHCKKAFIKRFGMQCDIFNKMTAIMDGQEYITPDLEICYAIKDTRA